MSLIPSNDNTPCDIPALSPELISLPRVGASSGYDESLTPPATALPGHRGSLSGNIFNRLLI